MAQGQSVHLKNSIASQMLKVVMGIYFLIALFVTGVHMTAEYHDAKISVNNEVGLLFQTFEYSLASPIWEYDVAGVESVINGLINIPIITGIIIQNEKGEEISRIGQTDNQETNEEELIDELFINRFPIMFHIDKSGNTFHVGYVTIYSSFLVVFQRVGYGFILIFINAIIKTIALWVIFFWVVKRFLSTPLMKLTQVAASLDVENLENLKVDMRVKGKTEIKVLEDTFNTMIKKIFTATQKLKESEHQYRLDVHSGVPGVLHAGGLRNGRGGFHAGQERGEHLDEEPYGLLYRYDSILSAGVWIDVRRDERFVRHN